MCNFSSFACAVKCLCLKIPLAGYVSIKNYSPKHPHFGYYIKTKHTTHQKRKPKTPITPFSFTSSRHLKLTKRQMNNRGKKNELPANIHTQTKHILSFCAHNEKQTKWIGITTRCCWFHFANTSKTHFGFNLFPFKFDVTHHRVVENNFKN